MTTCKIAPPVVLAIAGFDPTGCAGVLVDVRTIEAFDCRALAAITSLTFQDSQKVAGAVHQTAESLRAQLSAIINETTVAAIKIGMVPTREVITELSTFLRQRNLPPPVIDPVLRSSSGFNLIEEGAIDALVKELLPQARIVTPNIPEAERLTGLRIHDEAAMRDAAAKLRALGVQAVLIKAGHLKGRKVENKRQKADSAMQVSHEAREAADVLDDGGEVTTFRREWIEGPNVRGTGCMLSSAIAACLARKKSLEESARLAKDYVWHAIQNSSQKTGS